MRTTYRIESNVLSVVVENIKGEENDQGRGVDRARFNDDDDDRGQVTPAGTRVTMVDGPDTVGEKGWEQNLVKSPLLWNAVNQLTSANHVGRHCNVERC